MIVTRSRDDVSFAEFQCSPSSKADLSTPIKPIVAILTGLVTPEPFNFRAPVAHLFCCVTDGTQRRIAGIAEEIQ
jgi:hypothetical protein